MTAKDILGNPDYLAISYGGYRKNSRENSTNNSTIKRRFNNFSAMGIKDVRTYNVHLPQAVKCFKSNCMS